MYNSIPITEQPVRNHEGAFATEGQDPSVAALKDFIENPQPIKLPEPPTPEMVRYAKYLGRKAL